MANWKVILAVLYLMMVTAVLATAGERLSGEFVIHNLTPGTVTYQVQWGSDGKWEETTLRPQDQRTHGYPLDNDGRAPSPSCSFSVLYLK